MRTFITWLLLCCAVWAGEREECEALAEKYGMRNEVRLDDGTRVDLLDDTYAYEVDWSKKWAEGIGQSLYYAIKTERKPAVILLLKGKDERYIVRCRTVCEKYGITLFVAYEGRPILYRAIEAKGDSSD